MKGNYFFGLLLILIGVVFMANRFLNLDIPVFTTIFAFACIFWGIYIIKNGFGIRTRSEMVFHEGEIKASDIQNKYDIIFSSGTVDLRDLPLPASNRRIKIATVFARGVIRINPEIPAVIKVSSAFGSARMPNNSFISFGSYTYNTRSYSQGKPYVYIEADVVFGNLEIVEF